MNLNLEGKVVLVTGGSKGIGLACALAFAREGARVAIASRSAEHLAKGAAELAAQGFNVKTVAADLRQATDAQRMAAEVSAALGHIDILVNSAGAAQRTPPDELAAEHWHAAMDAKYFTTIHAMQAVLPAMAKRGSGAVVNVVGLGGKLATPTHLPGGAANAAIMLASAGLAQAYAPRGVRVNVVNPGLVATERMLEGFVAQARMSGETLQDIEARSVKTLPQGRLCQPHEVANVVLFLAAGVASYVSGAAVSVDGAATTMIF